MRVRPHDALTRSITVGEISILCMLTSSMREHPLAGYCYRSGKQCSGVSSGRLQIRRLRKPAATKLLKVLVEISRVEPIAEAVLRPDRQARPPVRLAYRP